MCIAPWPGSAWLLGIERKTGAFRPRPMTTRTRIDVAAESPLHQFTVERLIPIHIGSVDASFTNASLLMLLAVIAITAFLVLSMRGAGLVPNRFQSMAELSYEFIANMVRDTVGDEGKPYFPFLF